MRVRMEGKSSNGRRSLSWEFSPLWKYFHTGFVGLSRREIKGTFLNRTQTKKKIEFFFFLNATPFYFKQLLARNTIWPHNAGCSHIWGSITHICVQLVLSYCVCLAHTHLVLPVPTAPSHYLQSGGWDGLPIMWLLCQPNQSKHMIGKPAAQH